MTVPFLSSIKQKKNSVEVKSYKIPDTAMTFSTHMSAWPCRTRFGGVPVRVASPPTLAAYAIDNIIALQSLEYSTSSGIGADEFMELCKWIQD